MLLTLACILAIMAGRVDLNEKDEGAYGPPEERYVKKLGMAKVTNCKGDRVRRRGNSITGLHLFAGGCQLQCGSREKNCSPCDDHLPAVRHHPSRCVLR